MSSKVPSSYRAGGSGSRRRRKPIWPQIPSSNIAAAGKRYTAEILKRIGFGQRKLPEK